MRSHPKLIFAVLAVFSLSACMSSDLERAGAGALVGGLATAAVNGNVAAGVIIGTAGGALCDDLNLC